MIFDSLLLASVRDELGKALVGGKIDKIMQPDPLEIVLRVYHAGHKHDLLLSCDPEAARAHLTIQRRDNPPSPPPFCSLLRKHLDGAWIDDIALPSGFGERILHLHFKAVDGARLMLIAEIMGKHSNLILVTEAGTILGAAKNIGRGINRFRQVLPGLPYIAPPRQRGRRDPFAPWTPESEAAMTEDEAREWLGETWSGVSPLLAREVVLRANTHTPQALYEALTLILTVVRVGDWAPRLWTDPQGMMQGAYPIVLRSVPAADQHVRESISVALDHAATSLIRRDTFARAKESLLAALHRTRRHREREAEELGQGLRNAQRAEEYRQTGDLLLTNQSQIGRGQALVSVPDYYAPPLPDGEPTMRFIALDPTLSVHENAERFYKRSRKAETSALTLKERRAQALEESVLLMQAERETTAAKTSEEVAAIRTSMAESLARGPHQVKGEHSGTGKPKANVPDFEGHRIKTFRTLDGWEIWVGENASSNDYLTTKLAVSSDIWLHVRAATSAHGIIRAQNRPAAVSASALQQAAEMVAARSESKHSSLIPVDYTLKKHVRKPRKSAPGAVTYTNEKTLFVAGIHGE